MREKKHINKILRKIRIVFNIVTTDLKYLNILGQIPVWKDCTTASLSRHSSFARNTSARLNSGEKYKYLDKGFLKNNKTMIQY